ncbi:DNA methyltransferase [Mesorhizobium sp. KR2-14]|uniref:DNA methyltransferase n=1 Tax=Mesorhizobium sp. KR2-14 TaxID=3156610 RepID=UPI0032B592D1
MKFAPLIREARQRALLSQSELAKAVGVSPRAIWLAEQGAGTLRTLVPVLEFLRIAIAGLPPASTLGARFRAARLKREMSLQDLADQCGLSIPTLRSLERGVGRIACLEAAIRVLAPSIRVRKSSKTRREAPRGVVSAPFQKFINADCIETMQSLPAGSISLVTTSPPYNAGKEYESDLSVREYMQFAERWISCIPRLLTPTGALWINVGHIMHSNTEAVPLTYHYYPLLVRHGLRLVQEVVWHARGGLRYGKRFAHRTERWMWFVKNPENYIFNLDDVRDGTLNITDDPRNSPQGQNPTDYWHYPRVVGGRGASPEKTEHPCQFPVAMVERIIRACSNPGDVVLDPFGGAGSTAVAAFLNNRSSISVEIDRRYHNIAKSRLDGVRQQHAGQFPSPQEEHWIEIKTAANF